MEQWGVFYWIWSVYYRVIVLIMDRFISDAEQYDTFVKFTHDQLMRRFEEQPASCKYFT